MGRLIQIRGTNGSGKTHIIHELMNRFIYHINDYHLYFPDWDLYVIGRYFNDDNQLIPTGGCDQMSINHVANIIDTLRKEDKNILFEGAKESRTYKRWLRYSELTMIHLDTSLEDCIKNREDRRQGRESYWDDSTLIDGYEEVRRWKHRYIDEGRYVYTVSVDEAIPLIHRLLFGKYRNTKKDLVSLSGSGKRTHTIRSALYSSMPMFPDTPAVRDTRKRFREFGIDQLDGTVIDMGSNVGALSFLTLEYGAESVVGFEYSWERVEFCNRLADDRARFIQVDFREHFPNMQADYVFCCSVDEYFSKARRLQLYEHLRYMSKKTLFFECNVQRGQSVEDTINYLKTVGFESVEYLGSGDDGGISRKRRIYRCK